MKISNFFLKYKFELLSSSIFIIYAIIHYGYYGDYKGDWGVDQYFVEEMANRIIDGKTLTGYWSNGLGFPLVALPFNLHNIHSE